MANNLGLDPFPDPVGHFEAPWWPFYIFEVLKEGMIESKNLFSESWSEGPITEGLTYIRTPSAIWIEWAGRCCGRCGVAGGERVPPAPLGWYLTISVILLYLGLYQCHLGASRCILVNLGLSRTIWGLHFFDMDCFWIKNFWTQFFLTKTSITNNNDHNFNGFWRNWNYPSLWDIWTV